MNIVVCDVERQVVHQRDARLAGDVDRGLQRRAGTLDEASPGES